MFLIIFNELKMNYEGVNINIKLLYQTVNKYIQVNEGVHNIYKNQLLELICKYIIFFDKKKLNRIN